MYIKSIVLEGFKSYGQRTVIENFDPEFNAITGLNGTGKSNILDSICFVLGITQLSNVRVTSLQDLVYKSGQAGITRASVSITFDNLDKNNSPAGFEADREITVTRQVVIGGKNKYMIDGVNVPNKKVQDLFCSVQLNVNNPHFLIMQGRITKVLNMKPPEILSMVEEAAGTKMYENKKENAKKSIEKKDAKLKEINDLCNEELFPKLNKLREERKMFLEFQRIERELENLSSMYMAWQFIQSKKLMKQTLENLELKKSELKSIREKIQNNNEKVKQIEEQVDEHQQRDSKSSQDLQEFEKSVKESEKNLAKADAAEKAIKQGITAEQKKKKQFESSLEEDRAALQSKEAEYQNMNSTFESLKNAEASDKAAFLAAQKKFEALNAGMEIGDDGQAATLQEQLIKAKQDAVQAATSVKQATMELQHNEAQLKEKQGNFGSTAADYKKDKVTMENTEKELQTLTRQLQNLNYEEDKILTLQDTKRNLIRDCRSLEDKMARFEAQYPQVDFQYTDPERNFNRRSVKGIVCKLFSLRDPAFAVALETAAGGRLFNIITDTELTSKKLLQNGNLQHRTTIIPLNKIKGNSISSSTVDYAQSLVGKNNVFSALSVIQFDNELKPAMDYIFGSVLICKDLNIAKKVAFDNRILRKCVTLDGDVVDPAGVLSGGAKKQGGSFLILLNEYKDYQSQHSAREQELTKLDSQIQNLQKIGEKYTEIKHKYDITAHKFSILQSRLQETSHYQQQEEIEKLKKAIAELSESIKLNKEKEKSCLATAKKIETDIKNSKNNREQKIKQVETEMKNLKKQFENSKNLWKEKEQYYESMKLEISELKSSIENGIEQIKRSEANIITLEKELEGASETAKEAKEAAVNLQSELKEKKRLLASKNKEIQKKLKEKADLIAQVSEFELEIKKKNHEWTELENKCQDFKEKEKELKKKIRDDDTRLKDAENMTDKEGHELGKRIAKSQEHRNKMSRNINKKAQNMFEQEEKQYSNLMKKKKIVEKDRQQLLVFIEEMDKKMISFLQTAVEQISKDFGSIMSTLLPGTDAKLNPPDGKSVLNGLEIKVGLGGIWKDNLNELSGGQKSLIALSLILAMLLFKPAPIYILDEVDAALDLSHTQNIGKMLKKHFKQSQFIIVSLKDGMFNNANVLYRTKFVDGMSAVTRTANETNRKQ